MWWKILRRWFKQIWTRIQLWCKGMKSMSCSWNNKSLRRRKNNRSCYCIQMPWTSKEEGMSSPMTAKEAQPIASEAMPGRELRANSTSKARIKKKRTIITITRKRRRGLIHLISTSLALLMRAVMQRPRGPLLSFSKAPTNQSSMQFQHSSINNNIKQGYR